MQPGRMKEPLHNNDFRRWFGPHTIASFTAE